MKLFRAYSSLKWLQFKPHINIHMDISAHNTIPEFSEIINSTNVSTAYGECFNFNVVTWEDTVYHR